MLGYYPKDISSYRTASLQVHRQQNQASEHRAPSLVARYPQAMVTCMLVYGHSSVLSDNRVRSTKDRQKSHKKEATMMG